jgi:hypothetical protein
MQVNVSRVEALTILATLLQPQHAILGAQLIELLATPTDYAAARHAVAGSGFPAAAKAPRAPRKAKAAPAVPTTPKPAPTKQKPAKAAKRGGTGAKRDPEALAALTEKLRTCMTNNPGMGVEFYGTALGVTTRELTLPIKKLLDGKFIKKHGQKRATRYEVVEAKAKPKHVNGVATAAE